MRIVFHYISMAGTFLFLYGVLYLILDYTVGQIPFVKNATIGRIPLTIPIFSVLVIAFIVAFVKISSPWMDE